MFETVLAIISAIALFGLQIYLSIKNSGKMPYVFAAIFFGLSLLWFIILMSLTKGSLNESLLIFGIINIPTLSFLLIHALTRLFINLTQKQSI